MLARFFIDRPVLAWVISIVIVLLGGIAAALLPIAEYPGDHAADGSRDRQLPGRQCASRRRHGRRADRAAGQRRRKHAVHVVAMRATTARTRLDVTFELGTDLNMAQVLVQNRVAIAQPMLPDVVKSDRRDRQETIARHSAGRRICIPTTIRTPGKPYFDQLYMSNYATIQLMDALARLEGVGDVFIVRRAGLQHARLARSRTSCSRAI